MYIYVCVDPCIHICVCKLAENILQIASGSGVVQRKQAKVILETCTQRVSEDRYEIACELLDRFHGAWGLVEYGSSRGWYFVSDLATGILVGLRHFWHSVRGCMTKCSTMEGSGFREGRSKFEAEVQGLRPRDSQSRFSILGYKTLYSAERL